MLHGHKWWDEWFLGLAAYVSTASKDPSTKIGAILVDPMNVVRGMGYNGFPREVLDSDERLNDREIKYKMVVHAEVNAILNAGHSSKGCRLYVTPTLMKPNICPDCAKVAIQAGITEVIGWNGPTNERWEQYGMISKAMLDEAGVVFRFIEKDQKE